ncbi:MAG: hypothetical protein IKP66_07175 [Lachnospiraceae bacterium]|nr:hypothetical protein [Lachnospiraceae bacterium]
MGNIVKILKRLNEVYVKQRVLLMCLIAQNTILSLIMLIFANVIISNGNTNGELDYSQIKLFYNIAIMLLFFIIDLFAPILLSRSLSDLYKKNIIEHLLSVRISMRDIVYAVYFRGLSTLLILLVSSFPIIVISFYFGGFGVIKMLRLLIIILSYAMLFSSICLYVSTRFIDENATTIVSYVIGIVLTAINMYYLHRLLNNTFLAIIYALFCVIVALILISVAKKTTIFSA